VDASADSTTSGSSLFQSANLGKELKPKSGYMRRTDAQFGEPRLKIPLKQGFKLSERQETLCVD